MTTQQDNTAVYAVGGVYILELGAGGRICVGRRFAYDERVVQCVENVKLQHMEFRQRFDQTYILLGIYIYIYKGCSYRLSIYSFNHIIPIGVNFCIDFL